MAEHHGQRARELIAARKVEDSFSTMDRVMSQIKRKTHDNRQTKLEVRPVIDKILKFKSIQTLNFPLPLLLLKKIEGPKSDSGEHREQSGEYRDG